MIKKPWTFWDYLQDATGIILKSFYGSTIILGILWFATILGLFDVFIPGLKESFYSLWTLGSPLYFLALLVTIPVDIIFHSGKIKSRSIIVNKVSYTINLNLYAMWTVLSIGFGVIFGTVSLFADGTKDIYGYMLVVGVSLSLSNIFAIIARGYLHDSPITEFFVKHFRNFIQH